MERETLSFYHTNLSQLLSEGKIVTPLGLDFAVMPNADRANVVYCDLEALFAFVVGLVSLILKTSEKHSYIIPLMVRRVRMVAETILGRTFEAISTRVERRSSLTCLPYAYIIHGNVIKS